jgi:hypothetical protein
MFGRKDYTQEEIDNAKTAVNSQIAAYQRLTRAVDGAPADPTVASALEALFAEIERKFL